MASNPLSVGIPALMARTAQPQRNRPAKAPTKAPEATRLPLAQRLLNSRPRMIGESRKTSPGVAGPVTAEGSN